MKSIFYFKIILLLLFIPILRAQTPRIGAAASSNLYFPVNSNVTLIYKSSFGESTTKYLQAGEYTVSASEADKFKYRQIMLIKDDGVYVKEVYQYIKIFLFIKKENTYTYAKPFLRMPFPLYAGLKWDWEGVEYTDGDSSIVKVTGRVVNKEFVDTQAGRFEAMKLESVIEGSGSTKNRVTEWFAEGIGLIKAKIIIEGGGVMGFVRDLLGYGTIEFELKEIKRQ